LIPSVFEAATVLSRQRHKIKRKRHSARTHAHTQCLSKTNRHLLHVDSKQHTARW